MPISDTSRDVSFAPNSYMQSCIALEFFGFYMCLTKPWESEVIEGSLKESRVQFWWTWILCVRMWIVMGENRAYTSKKIVRLYAEVGGWAECGVFIYIFLLLLSIRLSFLTLHCRTKSNVNSRDPGIYLNRPSQLLTI